MKWIHLSDFHFGKDGYDEEQFGLKIIDKLSDLVQKGNNPDAIFVTGDIAYGGITDQYNQFDTLLLKIDEMFPEKTRPRIYVVPGNHDLNRKQYQLIEKGLYSYFEKGQPNQLLDPTDEGYKLREPIIARFSDFRKSFKNSLCYSPEDIFSQKGYFLDSIEKNGKQVGIAGINTAWLSHSKQDKENITPGFPIMESVVKALEKYQYRIVLGHHPVSWFRPEESRAICSLFAKNNVIYLYGHLHVKEAGIQTAVSGKDYIQFGAGAAFLPRETDQLRHSIQYGELHEHGVSLRSFQWSKEQQEWLPDFPNFYPKEYYEESVAHWFFPFPSPKSLKPPPKSLLLGKEWTLLGKTFVKKWEAISPSENDMLLFFDGQAPEYSFVFSPQIPIRKKTADYVNEFLLAEQNRKSKCMLLTGAGGEGKSTLSLQIIKLLALQDWVILHCFEPEKGTRLKLSDIEEIDGPMLVAVDNASRIAAEMYRFLSDAQTHGKHIHLLMVSDWASWSCLKTKWDWNAVSDYSMNTIAGIAPEEARAIVEAWNKYGENGLGVLAQLEDLDVAADELYSQSQSAVQLCKRDGALLGAIIQTRYGNKYLAHVRSILSHLQRIPLNLPNTEDTLLDAFIRIALMHNENQFILGSDILAELYCCSERDIKRAILYPLRKEAVTAKSGEVICVRHSALAKNVMHLIEEEFDDIVWQDYLLEMVEAAIRLRTDKDQYVYKIESWRYLANHFLDKGAKPLAVRIAETVYSIDRGNGQVLQHLVNVYLASPDPEYSIAYNALKEFPLEIYDEMLLHTFARIAAHMGEHELSVYLNCVAMSDQAKCCTRFEVLTARKCWELADSVLKLPQCIANEALSKMGQALNTAAAAIDDVQTGSPLNTAGRNAIGQQLEAGVAELSMLLETDTLPRSIPKEKKITFQNRLLVKV